MDADSDHGGHEGIMLFRMDHHTMQAVVIEYPVIDPFRCRALIIDFFVGIRAARYFRIKSDIPFGSGLYDTSIFGRNTAVPAFRAVVYPEGTAPHEVTSGLIIAVGNHAQLLLAEWRTVLINSDCIRYRFRPSAFIVKVNKSPDLPVFQETVSGIVVHGGIKADIFCGK